MARDLGNDERWEIVRPLLPPLPPHKTPAGRKRIDQRRVVTGIGFILQSGISWVMLPGEMGCGSGMRCWRRARLATGQRVGAAAPVLLAKLQGANRRDFSRVIADSSPVCAVHGIKNRAQPDCSEQGGQQAPLARRRRRHAAQCHPDRGQSQRHPQLMPLPDGRPPLGGRRGRPLTRPKRGQADRGYDCEAHRRILRRRRICPQVGKRCREHGSHRGLTRCVVERPFAWRHPFRW
jgi:transposase